MTRKIIRRGTGNGGAMSEFTLPLTPRDQGWVELRARLARAAREIHFFAVSNDSVNGSALLTIAGNFAGLAMKIPMCPAQGAPGGPVDPSTLVAAQMLQRDDGEATPAPARIAE